MRGQAEPQRTVFFEPFCSPRSPLGAGATVPRRGVRETGGYCWPTSFKVLGVLFLGEVYSAFLPSKKACWAHQFWYLEVDQQ